MGACSQVRTVAQTHVYTCTNIPTHINNKHEYIIHYMHKLNANIQTPPPPHPSCGLFFVAWPVFPNEQLPLCWAGNCKISKALDEKWLPTLSASRSRKLCTLLFVVSLLRARGENYSPLFFFAIRRSCFLLYVECVGSEEVWWGGRLMLSSLWLVSVFLLRWTRTEGEEGRKGEGGIREAA